MPNPPDAREGSERPVMASGLALLNPPPAAPVAMAQPRILLLDDDPFQLVMQSFRLNAAGFRYVTTLDTAAAALRALGDDPKAFDIIICDLNMPGMDGIEFLQSLGAGLYAGQVVLLSGEGTRIMHTVQALLGKARLSILGAVEKPAAGDALSALLRRWESPSREAPARLAHVFDASEIELATELQQWVLHYQPKVDLRTGRLVGAEALVRWNHPEHGLVYPDSFIGLAEDCGAIDMLTEWVLREAIGQLAAWHAHGLEIQVAVNVSMENLRAPDFARRLGVIAHDAGVSTGDVTLEITESRLMAPSPAPLESLVRLRLRRFKLSIDDFGTGHSSLAQLRDVPFTELKVDRGFVSGARFNPIIRPILEGSIRVAKGLDMQSVAEGVETEEDWQLLREMGCDLAQGYFIGRPMPSDGFLRWHDGWLDRRARLLAA